MGGGECGVKLKRYQEEIYLSNIDFYLYTSIGDLVKLFYTLVLQKSLTRSEI